MTLPIIQTFIQTFGLRDLNQNNRYEAPTMASDATSRETGYLDQGSALYKALDQNDGTTGNGFSDRDINALANLHGGLVSLLQKFYPEYTFQEDAARRCIDVKIPSLLLQGDFALSDQTVTAILADHTLALPGENEVRVSHRSLASGRPLVVAVEDQHGNIPSTEIYFDLLLQRLEHSPLATTFALYEHVNGEREYTEGVAQWDWEENNTFGALALTYTQDAPDNERAFRSTMREGFVSINKMRLMHKELRAYMAQAEFNRLKDYARFRERIQNDDRFFRIMGLMKPQLALKARYGDRITFVNLEAGTTTYSPFRNASAFLLTGNTGIDGVEGQRLDAYVVQVGQLSQSNPCQSRALLDPPFVRQHRELYAKKDKRSATWAETIRSAYAHYFADPDQTTPDTVIVYLGGGGHSAKLLRLLQNQYSTLFLRARRMGWEAMPKQMRGSP